MKLRHLVAALPLFLPVVAFADEPVDTVRVLMGMASHNSADPADGARRTPVPRRTRP